MQWIWSLLHRPTAQAQGDREAFARREAALRDRYERLERLAVEADVIRHADTPENSQWGER